jgi:hypothetical protein
MCYYTITTNVENKEGHLQALMIIDAKNELEAKMEYMKTFDLADCNVNEGIRIPDGFAGLVTESIKKAIYKHATGRANLPLVSYCNRIFMKYDEE